MGLQSGGGLGDGDGRGPTLWLQAPTYQPAKGVLGRSSRVYCRPIAQGIDAKLRRDVQQVHKIWLL